jgi:general stress protein 26
LRRPDTQSRPGVEPIDVSGYQRRWTPPKSSSTASTARPAVVTTAVEPVGYIGLMEDTNPGTPSEQARKVAELMKGVRIAMLTCVGEGGKLVSRPMATQDVDFDGDVWFIAERSSEKVAEIRRSPQVNVAYSGNGTWVSLSGRAEVVDDTAKLAELWNTFTDAWLEGGPDNPENVLVHVDAESAEYWDGPGSKVTQVLNLVKAKATGRRLEGDNESVDL